MKLFSKLVSMALAIAMVLSLVACGQEPAAASGSQAIPITSSTQETSLQEDFSEEALPESGSVSLPISEYPLTYTMFMTEPFFIGSLINTMEDDLGLFQAAQKTTNIYFDVTAVNGEVFSEQFQLMSASGDYRDVMDGMSNYAPGYDAAIEEGICMDVYDLVKTYAPNYLSTISRSADTLAQLVTDDGQMATFGICYKEANAETQGYLIRQDWLDELGLSIPETYDQLHDVLVAFQHQYGCNGMFFEGIADERLSYGYECGNGEFMVLDGTVTSGYTLDSYYDFLCMCRDWYAEGLIYSDFFTATTGDYDQLLIGNDCGIVQGAATSFSTIYAYLTEEEKEGFALSAMTPVKKNTTDELHYSWNVPNYLKRTDAWSISGDCQDPIPLVQFVNYMYSDEGELLFNYGTEELTFTYDQDGTPQYTDLVINNPDQPYFFASYLYASNAATEYFPGIMDVSASYYSFGDAEWQAYELFSTLANDGSYNMPAGVALTEEESTRYAQLSSDFDTYVETTVTAWIVGQEPLDEAAFAAFQAQLQALGLEEMTQIKQNAYDRYGTKLAALGF